MTLLRNRLPADELFGSISVAATPDRIDAAWLDTILRAAKVIGNEIVTAVSFEPVGHGLMSDSFRFKIEYDRPSANAPATVVGKFAAADPTSKATATEYEIYQCEVGFYRDIAHTIDARVPRAHFAKIDTATSNFTVIMEDAAPARAIDQIEGCSIEDAVIAVREVARLHGLRWNDPTLADIPWLRRRAEMDHKSIAALSGHADGFLERFVDQLEPEHKAAVKRLPAIFPKVLLDTRSPRTVQHGDYRLDNLLFDVKGEAGSIVVLDWGTVSRANGLTDVSYFIGASLDAPGRRDHERELVRIYFDELSKYPIGNYDWDACWADYVRFCFSGLATAVVASMVVERNERADRLFLGMLRNHTEQMHVLGSFNAWD